MRGGVEPLEEAEAAELGDRVRQRVDADAELADRIRLLVDLARNAARVQHQRGRKAADAAADDDGFH